MSTTVAVAELQFRHRAVAFFVSVAIPLEFLAVTALSLKHYAGPVLYIAAAMDSLILFGGALWILSRSVGGYKRLGLAQAKIVPETGVFTTFKTSQSGFLLPFIGLMSAVEMPLLHVGLKLWAHAPPAVHAGLVGLHLYGLLWLLGDRRLMRETGHRLTRTTLDICLGQRWRATLPYSQIEKVGLQPQPPVRRDRDTRDVTPWDSPNVHLCLRGPVTLVGYFGIKRNARHVRLFVDSPQNFIAALKPRIEAEAAER